MKQRQTSSIDNRRSKTLSIVVPCYEEQDNVRSLCTRLFAACKKANIDIEVILVDDFSENGTELTIAAVDKLKGEGYNIDLILRTPDQGTGLSSAIILGFTRARYSTLLCMDADLQHEPESVPDVAAPVLNGNADFSVGSRHVAGGETDNFPLVRRIISHVATTLAYPLTSSTDPMSGFFCVRKEAFDSNKKTLNPIGYKICLELMVRCQCKRVCDVPICFRDREAGHSKLTMKQNFYYLCHLMRLYWFKFPVQIVLSLLGLLILSFKL